MKLAKLFFKHNEDTPDLLINMKLLNVILIFIQFLFGLYMMPGFIIYEIAVLASIGSMAPSLILLFLPGFFEDENVKEMFENIYYTVIGVGLIIFLVALYYAFLEGNSDEIVEWLHVWLIPLLLSLTYAFISDEVLVKKEKKMAPVVHLPQEPLMNIN